MDTSVYIFLICLDVFIAFTIFAIYFYVLFKYYIHSIESDAIINNVNTHLQFYKPIIKLIKEYSKTNVNNTVNLLQQKIDNTQSESEKTNFTVGTIMIISMILGLFVIVMILFAIYYKKIIEQISITNVIFTIIINIILIVGFELLFIFLVYCNIDVCNIQKILNIQ